MPTVDMYSSRQKQDQQSNDVWVYDRIPDVLRMQVSNIVEGALCRKVAIGAQPRTVPIVFGHDIVGSSSNLKPIFCRPSNALLPYSSSISLATLGA